MTALAIFDLVEYCVLQQLPTHNAIIKLHDNWGYNNGTTNNNKEIVKPDKF